MKYVVAVVVAGLFLCQHQAQSAVNLGDKPKLEFEAVDGSLVSLEEMKGKLVLVEFWATWCHVCVEHMPEVVALKTKLEEKGLRLIGVSLDTEKEYLDTYIKKLGVTWPQHFDGKGREGPLVPAWGVNATPTGFLIGPDGAVLWKGHIGNAEKVVEEALRKNPPRVMDKKTASEIGSALDRVEAGLGGNDSAAVMAALGKVPASAVQEPQFAARISAMREKAEAMGSSILEESKGLVGKGDHLGAAMKLRPLAAVQNLRSGRKAGQELATLMGRADVKLRIEVAEKMESSKKLREESEGALTAARKLQEEKKDEQAYAAFKAIVTGFKETPAAATAAQEIAKYEKDPAFTRKVNDKAAEGKAKGILTMAASLKAAGKPELAKQRYQLVIDQYPNTTFAETAKRELAGMNQK